MKKQSPFIQPLIWMVVGPPAFRLTSTRTALSSVEGDQDIWNIIRLVWWLCCGGIALVSLVQNRRALGPRWSFLGSIPIWSAVWLAALFGSTLLSPSPEYTLASATMMLMLVFGGLDLALKISMNRVSIDGLVRAILYVSVGMLSLVGILYLTIPEMMGGSGWTYSGHRIRGEGIAYTPMVAQVVIFCGIYLAYVSRGRIRLLFGALALYGFWWISLAQTRSAYVTIVFGLGIMCWHWFDLRKKMVHLLTGVAAIIAVICVITFAYDSVHGVRWRLDKVYDRYVLRDEFAIEDEEAAAASLATLNGRTEAQSVLFSQAVKKPLGMGYIAGTRSYMASVVDQLPSDAFHGAHNAYLEIMSGAGFAAILGFLLLIGGVLSRGWRVRDPISVLCRVGLYTILLEALVESNLAFPFHQTPVYFWIWTSCLVGLFVRSRLAPAAAPAPEVVQDDSRREFHRPSVAGSW